MGEDQGQERTQLTDDPEARAARLRAEIEDVREELGDTAEALAAKTDVKARARERVEEIKRTAAGKKDALFSGGEGGTGTGSGPSPLETLRTRARENPIVTAVVAALVGGFILGRLSRRGA